MSNDPPTSAIEIAETANPRIATLLLENRDYLIKVCKAYGLQHVDAEDVVQEAVLKLLSDPRSIALNLLSVKKAGEMAYLRTAVTHACLARRTKRAVEHERFRQFATHGADSDSLREEDQLQDALSLTGLEDAIKVEEINQLYPAIKSLTPEERDVFVLSYLLGMTLKDICVVVGKSLTTVYWIKKRARGKLRDAFGLSDDTDGSQR